jgi:hypothetical protein
MRVYNGGMESSQRTIDCTHCGAVVMVEELVGGCLGENEDNWLPCPVCKEFLFSWERPRIYDTIRVISRGKQSVQATTVSDQNPKPSPVRQTITAVAICLLIAAAGLGLMFWLIIREFQPGLPP